MQGTQQSINHVLARNLAYWMEQADLTQSALADKAGVSQKTISNYLNPDQRGESKTGKQPSAKLTELEAIASALGIGVWQLVRQMTDRERKMYETIERAYVDLVAQAAPQPLAEPEQRSKKAASTYQRALRASNPPPPAPAPAKHTRIKRA